MLVEAKVATDISAPKTITDQWRDFLGLLRAKMNNRRLSLSSSIANCASLSGPPIL